MTARGGRLIPEKGLERENGRQIFKAGHLFPLTPVMLEHILIQGLLIYDCTPGGNISGPN
jgi:hypothetical protein